MAIQDDFTVAANGDIRYVGAAHAAATAANYYRVIDFHRWLMSLADDQQAVSTSSDYLDITDTTPSERQTDNIIQLIAPYNIDQTAAEHLYDGSIIQNGGDDIWDGLVVIASPGMTLQIHQNGAVISAANSFWNSQNSGAAYAGLNYDLTSGYSHRFMLKVRTAGTDIDGRRLIGQTRVWGKTFSEFKIGTGTARGNNVLALTYAGDNNNLTASGTVATWSDISLTSAGYNALDIDANAANEYYYAKWNVNKPTRSINNFYERFKYLTREGEVTTIFGLPGEQFRGITHEVGLTTPRSGTFSSFEKVTWGSGATAGEGQMLAIDSTTAGTKMWIQLLKGVVPSGSVTITGSTSSATATFSASLTERTLSFPACGQSTGSALIGAYGLTIESDDATSSDKITALDGTQRNPPNNQTFYVNGVVATEDQIIVGPKAAGNDIAYGQFLLNAGITSGASSITVKVGTETPGTGTNSATDTPATGTIRVEGDDGIYHRVTYTGYTVAASTMTFTGCSGAPTAAINNDVFISYVDKAASATSESYQATYIADRALWVRVRDGKASPTKTYESGATFGSAGGTASVIRTSDA